MRKRDRSARLTLVAFVLGGAVLSCAGAGAPTDESGDDVAGGDGGGPAVATGGAKGGGGAKGDGGPGATGGKGGASSQDGAPPVVDCGATTRLAAVPNADVVVSDKTIGVSLKYSGMNVPRAYSETWAGYFDEMGVNAVRSNGGTIWYTFGSKQLPFDGHTADEVKANPNALDWNAVATFYQQDKEWLAWAKRTSRIYFGSTVWKRNFGSSSACDKGAYVFRVGNQADEGAFWVSVFAYAYWANVLNDLDATVFEVSNEPDNCGGNGGTEIAPDGHNRMLELAKDALTYVNQTSGLVAPPKPAVLVGPGALSEWNGKAWVNGAASRVDVVSFHSYWAEHYWEEIQPASARIDARTGGKKKQWLTEWGQWWYGNGYSEPAVVHTMAPALVAMSLWNVEAQMPWSIEDQGSSTNGYVRSNGQKTRLYWLNRIFNRALLSEKDMLQTNFANQNGDETFAFATRDSADLYVIYMNQGTASSKIVCDLSAFPGAEGKTVKKWHDGPGMSTGEIVDPDTVVSGAAFSFDAQGDTYHVAKIVGAGGPSCAP